MPQKFKRKKRNEQEKEQEDELSRQMEALEVVDMKDYDQQQQLDFDIETDIDPDEPNDVLETRLHQWCMMWLFASNNETEVDTYRRMRRLFGATRDADIMSQPDLRQKYASITYRFGILMHELVRRGLAKRMHEDMNIVNRFTLLLKLNEAIPSTFYCLYYSGKMYTISSPRAAAVLPHDLAPWHFMQPEDSDNHVSVQALLKLLMKAYEYGYRRRKNGQVFERNRNSQGVPIIHFRPVLSMLEFISVAIHPIEHNHELMGLIYSGHGRDKQLADWLTRLPDDPRFPILEPNRKIVAYDDRCFFVHECRSYAHGDPYLLNHIAGHYIAQNFDHNLYRLQMARCVCLQSEMLAAKKEEYEKYKNKKKENRENKENEENEEQEEDEEEEEDGEDGDWKWNVNMYNEWTPEEQKKIEEQNKKNDEAYLKKHEHEIKELETQVFWPPACEECGTDYMRIQAPAYHSVLQTQHKREEECEWIYQNMARPHWNTKELENWQYAWFLIGVPGAGKSTTLNTIRCWFNQGIIGILEDPCERNFPLHGIYKSEILMGGDIGKRWNFPQATLQRMIEGGDVQAFRKSMLPEDILHWLAFIIIACNEFPRLVSYGGAMLRRALGTFFMRRPDHIDPFLDEKIRQELGALHLKCVLAYQSKTGQHAKKNIWDAIPPCMVKQHEKLAQMTNTFQAFLHSDWMILSRSGVADFSLVKTAYKFYCKEDGKLAEPMVEMLYKQPFKQLKIKLQPNGAFMFQDPEGKPLRRVGAHIIGARLNLSKLPATYWSSPSLPIK